MLRKIELFPDANLFPAVEYPYFKEQLIITSTLTPVEPFRTSISLASTANSLDLVFLI